MGRCRYWMGLAVVLLATLWAAVGSGPVLANEAQDRRTGASAAVALSDSCAAPALQHNPTPGDPGDYLIGVGDVLTVSVWRDDSLTSQVIVLPDGTIALPLIGTVHARGLALADLEEEVTRRLVHYIPDPVLSIAVARINSLMVYVIGKVNRPGRFELSDHINVLQALALAGGMNTFAKSDRIKIFRETGAETQIFEFDYDQVAKGQRLGQNIRLERGDVIVVP